MISFYRIYRSFEGGEKVLAGVVEPDSTSFTDSHRKKGGDYSYILVAVNELGESREPAVQDIQIEGDEEEEEGFIAKNAGLFITIPLILVLLVLLIWSFAGRRKGENGITPVPYSTEIPENDTESSTPYPYRTETENQLQDGILETEEYPGSQFQQ